MLRKITQTIQALRAARYVIKHQLLGSDGRPMRDTYGSLIEPDENKDFAFRQIDDAKIKNMRVSDALRTLIKTNTTLDFIVDTHQTFAVRNYTLTHNAEDGEAGEIARKAIEDYIAQAFGGIKSFRGILKQMAYYRLVEGGIALRVVYDPDSLFPKIEVLSPLSLVYVYVNADGGKPKDDERKYLIIGKKIKHNEIEIYYDERRSERENMNFVYVPTNLRGDQVFGSSQLATVLRPTQNRQKLSHQLGDFLEKRIYPKLFYWIDLTRVFARSEVSLKDISEYAKQGSNALKEKINNMDKPENHQDSVATAPIGVTEISGVGQGKLEGVDYILEVFEPEIQRGSRLPRILLGGQKGNVSLNDNESNVEWETFSIRNSDAAADISEAVTRVLVPVRLALGVDPFVGCDVGYDNLRYNAIQTEILDARADAYGKLITSGVITSGEARLKLKESSNDFSDIPDEPEEPVNPEPAGDDA